MKFNIFVIICCLFLSCSECGINDDKVPVITFLDSTFLNGVDFIFGIPNDIFLDDSIIIISDDVHIDTCFHVFCISDGSYIKSFGPKGRGPNEIYGSYKAAYNKSTNVLAVSFGRHITYFYVDKLLKGYDDYSTTQWLENERCCALTSLGGGFIYVMNSDSVRFRYNNARAGVQLIDDNIYLWEYNMRIFENKSPFEFLPTISSQDSLIVCGTYIGGVLEKFMLCSDGNLRKICERVFSESQYEEIPGATPRTIIPKDGGLLGFQNLILDSMIYVNYLNYPFDLESLFSMQPTDEIDMRSEIISVFSSDLIHKYDINLGNTILCFNISENSIYAVILTHEKETFLVKYSIPLLDK